MLSIKKHQRKDEKDEKEKRTPLKPTLSAWMRPPQCPGKTSKRANGEEEGGEDEAMDEDGLPSLDASGRQSDEAMGERLPKSEEDRGAAGSSG